LKKLLLAFLTACLLTAVPAQPAQAFSGPAAGEPGWITSTCYSHSRQADPIVSYGVYPSAHLHDFVGALSTDEFSTTESLQAGGTCSGIPQDTAAYWVPRLSTTLKGSLVPQAGQDRDMLAYYLRGAAAAGTVVQPFPPGFKLILGNSNAASAADNPDIGPHIWFKCGPGGNTHLLSPPSSCPSGHYMVVVYTFPQFWNGQRHGGNELDTMSYTKDAAHPITLPRLRAFWRYSPATGTIGTVSLASGPWYTVHMDFFNAWDQAALQSLVTRCINGGTDCQTDPAP